MASLGSEAIPQPFTGKLKAKNKTHKKLYEQLERCRWKEYEEK